MEPIRKASPESWNCSICIEPMAENTVISKRCHHVFHERCIKKALALKEECPECRLPFLTEYELLPNPETSEGYIKWKSDPERYAPVDLKPMELRGVKPERALKREEIDQYFHHGNSVVKNLGDTSTWDEIDSAALIAFNAHQGMIDKIKRDQNMVAANNAEMREMLGAAEERNFHSTLTKTYRDKVDKYLKKVNQRISELQRVPLNSSIHRFFQLSKDLIRFNQRFSEAANVTTRNYEDSRALMLEIDAELGSFLENQPQEVLRGLQQHPAPIEELPVPQYTNRSIPTIWKVAFMASLILGFSILYLRHSSAPPTHPEQPQI